MYLGENSVVLLRSSGDDKTEKCGCKPHLARWGFLCGCLWNRGASGDSNYVCKDCKTVFKKAYTDPLNIMDYGPSKNLLFRKYQWDILYNLIPITEQ